MYSIKDFKDPSKKICVVCYNLEQVKILNKFTRVSQLPHLDPPQKILAGNYPYGFTRSKHHDGTAYSDIEYWIKEGYTIITIHEIVEIYSEKIKIKFKLPKHEI